MAASFHGLGCQTDGKGEEGQSSSVHLPGCACRRSPYGEGCKPQSMSQNTSFPSQIGFVGHFVIVLTNITDTFSAPLV